MAKKNSAGKAVGQGHERSESEKSKSRPMTSVGSTVHSDIDENGNYLRFINHILKISLIIYGLINFFVSVVNVSWYTCSIRYFLSRATVLSSVHTVPSLNLTMH